MNYLAHVFLSFNNPKILLGNMIADAIKGKSYENYETEIVKGIQLHREIDLFTDTHPVVINSKARLYYKYHKYSSVITDIFYDHFLSINWEKYSTISIQETAKNTYWILTYNYEILPLRIKKILPFMVTNNWLCSYHNLDIVNRALVNIGKRTKYVSFMNEAIIDLKKYYGQFNAEFQAFFPELIKFSKDFLFSR